MKPSTLLFCAAALVLVAGQPALSQTKTGNSPGSESSTGARSSTSDIHSDVGASGMDRDTSASGSRSDSSVYQRGSLGTEMESARPMQDLDRPSASSTQPRSGQTQFDNTDPSSDDDRRDELGSPRETAGSSEGKRMDSATGQNLSD